MNNNILLFVIIFNNFINIIINDRYYLKIIQRNH